MPCQLSSRGAVMRSPLLHSIKRVRGRERERERERERGAEFTICLTKVEAEQGVSERE